MAYKKGKYTPGGYELRVKRSLAGLGLYTMEPIKKGACIIEYTGVVLTKEEDDASNSSYLFLVSKHKTIDGSIRSNKARYINHSCKPNCEADGPEGRVFIHALRGIKVGEELTYDYGDEYFEKHIRPKGCRCTTCAAKR